MKFQERLTPYLLLGLLTLGTGLGIGFGLAEAPRTRPINPAAGHSVEPPVSRRVTPVHLPVQLDDPQILAGGGSIYLLGDVQHGGGVEPLFQCDLVRLDPSTLKTTTTRISECGSAIWGDGALLVVEDNYVSGTADEEQLSLERVDPSSGHSTSGPPVMTLFGSARAHIGFAYGDDSVWIAGPTSHGAMLVEVSPRTGQLIQSWTLPIGFDTAVVAAEADGAWVTSTPGAIGYALFHVVTGSPLVTKVNDLSGTSGSSWLEPAGNGLVGLFVVLSDRQLSTVVGRVSDGGSTLSRSPGDLLSAGSFPADGPQQAVWTLDAQFPGCRTALLNRTDSATGAVQTIARFHSNVAENMCDAVENSPALAASGPWVFVLETWHGTLEDRMVRIRT